MQDMNWDDLRYVLAVARVGSLAGAARALRVNETTVARRLEKAERVLAARLFERNGGAYVPTAAGAEAVAAAERIELQMQAMAEDIAGRDQMAAGTVRITSVPIIANRILTPALPTLLKRHPELCIEIIAEPRDLSLTKREADVALRLARPTREMRPLARRVGDLAYAPYAPRRGRADRLPWLGYVDDMADLPPARWLNEQARRDGQPAPLRAYDAETLVHAVKSGLGRSLLPMAVGDTEPDLKRLSTDAPLPSRELWLMVHPDLRDLVRVRVVADWLAALAADLPRP